VGRNIDEKIILDLCKKFELINSNNNLNLESMVINNGSNISGGECQKISSLRAIVNNPQIIIFDEFSTFIDEKTKNIFYKYMRQNKAGKIIIVISHETQLDLEVDINIDLSKQKIHIDQNYKEAVL
jgi:ABC-type bacteriocin/lantibiotic exporter with double-glycine peptidase domain